MREVPCGASLVRNELVRNDLRTVCERVRGEELFDGVSRLGAVCENAATMIGRSLSLALLSVLILTAPVYAHDTWLAPDRYRAAAAGPVTLSLSSGMEFPKLDHAIAAERISFAKWQTARNRGDLPTGTSGAHALELRADASDGITVYSVMLHPRPSKLKREQVREYIDHLGIPNANTVYAEWDQNAKSEETGYRYTKYAKTFVRAGAAGTSRNWAEPADMRLELVPQSDPTSITAGSALDVVLVDRGKPVPRYPVALVREGAKEAIVELTDAGGRVRLAVPHAGRYMLRATILEPSADKTAAWDVHFTTMTFEATAK